MVRSIVNRPGRNFPVVSQPLTSGQTISDSNGKPGSREAGAHWEKEAESFLRSHGLKLLERNFSSRFGEIDLIMDDQNTLVFIEVKYRHSNSHGTGADAVTLQKQGKISRTAAWYLAKNPYRAEQICRFDVISMNTNETKHGINWIKAAFYSTIG